MGVDLKQLGMQALQNRRYAEAVAQLSMHLQAIPGDYEAGTALALAYLKVGQPEEAMRRFAMLTSEFSYSSSVHFHHGMALEELGKLEEAVAAFERVLKLRPKHGGASSRLLALRGKLQADPAPGAVKKSAAPPPEFVPAAKTNPAPVISLPVDPIEGLPDLEEISLDEMPPVRSPLPSPPAIAPISTTYSSP